MTKKEDEKQVDERIINLFEFEGIFWKYSWIIVQDVFSMVFNLSINIMNESKIISSLLSNDTILTLFARSKMKSFPCSPFSRSLFFISPHSSHCRSPQQNKFWYKKQRHNKWIKKDPKWIHLEQPNRLRCKEKQQRRCLSWSSCFPPQTSWLMQYHQYYGGLLSLAPRVPLFSPHHVQEHTQSTNTTNNRAFKDGCDITDFSKFGTRNPLIDDLHTDNMSIHKKSHTSMMPGLNLATYSSISISILHSL